MPLAAASTDLASQVAQLAGAICVLVAYAGAQFGLLSTHARSYLVLNLVGALVLGVLAAAGNQYGFLLLEIVWAGVSAWALLAVLRGRTPAGGAH